MHRSLPLTKYYPKVKKLKKLIQSSEETPEEDVPVLDEFGNKIYETYIKQQIYVYVTPDFTFHSRKELPV